MDRLQSVLRRRTWLAAKFPLKMPPVEAEKIFCASKIQDV
jgi:hypothetical protein